MIETILHKVNCINIGLGTQLTGMYLKLAQAGAKQNTSHRKIFIA